MYFSIVDNLELDRNDLRDMIQEEYTAHQNAFFFTRKGGLA